jgi:hypothetical protein
MSSDSFDIGDLKKEVTPSTASCEVFLDGSLVAEMEHLERQLEEARQLDETENRKPEAPLIAERLVGLHNHAKDKARRFTFTALSARAWSDLLADHPPRKEDREDGLDYNAHTLPHEAMARTGSPKLTVEDYHWLEENISPAQWLRLWLTCRAAHQIAPGPKAHLGATVTRLATGLRSTTVLPEESPGASSSAE